MFLNAIIKFSEEHNFSLINITLSIVNPLMLYDVNVMFVDSIVNVNGVEIIEDKLCTAQLHL